MKYEIKNKKGEVEIEITLDQKEWEDSVNEAYNKTKGKYKVEGFRAGKAPRRVIENMYGKSTFYEDALNDSFSKYYGEILDKERELDPVDMPRIDIKKLDENGVVMLATVTVRPEVKMGAYTGLGIQVKAKAPTAAEVDAELKRAQQENARLVEKKGEVAQGDIVNINFEGYIDGKKFDGGTGEDYDLEIGSHSFIDTFEDQLVGLKEGDKKDVKVTFPKDYHATELANKPAIFKVVVNAVKERQLPEINDAFASDVSSFETLAEYKKEIKDNLKKKADEMASVETENRIIDKIVEGIKVTVPDCMVDQELENIIQDMSYRLMYQGLRMEDYLNYLGTTMDEFKNKKRADAEKAVKVRLAMQEIIRLEKIDVTDKEVDDKIAEMAKNAGQNVKEYKEKMGDRLSYIANDILLNKLMAFLVKKNAPTVTK